MADGGWPSLFHMVRFVLTGSFCSTGLSLPFSASSRALSASSTGSPSTTPSSLSSFCGCLCPPSSKFASLLWPPVLGFAQRLTVLQGCRDHLPLLHGPHPGPLLPQQLHRQRPSREGRLSPHRVEGSRNLGSPTAGPLPVKIQSAWLWRRLGRDSGEEHIYTRNARVPS